MNCQVYHPARIPSQRAVFAPCNPAGRGPANTLRLSLGQMVRNRASNSRALRQNW